MGIQNRGAMFETKVGEQNQPQKMERLHDTKIIKTKAMLERIYTFTGPKR